MESSRSGENVKILEEAVGTKFCSGSKISEAVDKIKTTPKKDRRHKDH
jgi:hypothetical protein